MSAPWSAEPSAQERRALAEQQHRVLTALMSQEVPEDISHTDPGLVAAVTSDRHAENVAGALAFYLPRIAAELSISPTDWHRWFPGNPTTFQHQDRLEWFVQHLQVRLGHDPCWTDALRIEEAQFRVRGVSALSQPELVRAVRSQDEFTPSTSGVSHLLWGTVIETTTTLPDVFWIPGHKIASAVPFGPPRKLAFYRSPDTGAVSHRFFNSFVELGVALCFS